MSAIEELRAMAESVGLAIPQAATLMMNAADAINRLGGENIELRELVGALEDCRHTYCGDCVRWDYSNGECSLDSVLRELGMEVDG